MNIIAFTRYTRKGASSRLRFIQYIEVLHKLGYNVEVSPFFDDDYLNAFNSGQRKTTTKYFIKRLIKLLFIRKYDKILIEKELFPYLPAFFETLLIRKKYIVDFDDAVFHSYDQHKNILIKFLLKNKIKKVMKNSYSVIVGNDYLKEYAVLSKSRNIHILPTTINLDNYKISRNHSSEEQLIIGWIGTPSTFKHLKHISLVLKRIVHEFNVHVHIIGASEKLNFEKNVHYFEWSEQEEIKLISKFSIGIMPLIDYPFARGKCAYKLIQYMGCSKPVIASPIGMNNKVVIENFNGFLAHNNIDWYNSLKKLILDETLRKTFGNNSYKLVEKEYSVKTNFEKFKKIILS